MERERDILETSNSQAVSSNASDEEPLVAVRGLTKLFPLGGNLFRKPTGFIHAVDDVTFRLAHGESLGLVGESGCGKTTVGKLLVKLLDPTDGSIFFRFAGDSGDVADGSAWEFRRHQGTAVALFPQAGADDLPRPLRVHESPADHIRHHI